MNKQITCNVIRDIIPLYSENLCSEDSVVIVREHIEDCADCRRLLEEFEIVDSIPKAIPDEVKAMKKINGKIRRSKKVVIAVLCVLLAVLIPVAVLFGNIFVQNEKIPSFETIARNKEVKEYSDLIENGKFHSFARWISLNAVEVKHSVNMEGIETEFIDDEDLEKADEYIARLTDAYNALIGDKKAINADCRTYYSFDMFEERPKRKGMISEISVEYSGGGVLTFSFIKENGRFLWYCYSDGSFDEKLMEKFSECIYEFEFGTV